MSYDRQVVRKGWIKRLMDMCRGPKALPALGALSFLESSLLPVPMDLAMIPICLARPKELLKIVFVGMLGSLLGASFGYFVGAFLMEIIGDWLLSIYGMQESYSDFEAMYQKDGWRALALAGITPIPFKIAAIVSGALSMPFHVFVLTVAGIRFLRFAMMAIVILICGSGLQKALDRHGGKFTALMVVVMMLSVLVVPLIL